MRTKEEKRKYYLKNKNKVYASHRKYVKKNESQIRAYRKAYWANPKNRARRRELYRARIEHYKERDRIHYYNTQDRHRELHMAKRYGITVEYYRKLFIDQNNLCAICNLPERAIDKRSGKVRKLAVDHNHKTGRVRALLCQNCNQALGLLQENIELLSKIEFYLKTHAQTS